MRKWTVSPVRLKSPTGLEVTPKVYPVLFRSRRDPRHSGQVLRSCECRAPVVRHVRRCTGYLGYVWYSDNGIDYRCLWPNLGRRGWRRRRWHNLMNGSLNGSLTGISWCFHSLHLDRDVRSDLRARRVEIRFCKGLLRNGSCHLRMRTPCSNPSPDTGTEAHQSFSPVESEVVSTRKRQIWAHSSQTRTSTIWKRTTSAGMGADLIGSFIEVTCVTLVLVALSNDLQSS